MKKSKTKFRTKQLPDVAIVSYLGDTPAVRKARLGYHAAQREILSKAFGKLRVTTFCSGYGQEDIAALRSLGYKVVCVSMDRRHKWQVHNMLLRTLYETGSSSDGEQTRRRALLILDDDAVPLNPDGGLEDNRVSTETLVKFWLKNPGQMGAPLVYFAAHGMLNDSFYNSVRGVMVQAPPKVMGWAMMARNDLGVLWDKQLVNALCRNRRYTMDDTAFRVKCAAEGKRVLKHTLAFFRSLEPRSGVSTYAKDQDDRRALMAADEEILRRLYPEHAPRAAASRVRRESNADATTPAFGGLFRG